MFYHNDYWYPNAYSLAEFSWHTLEGYPEGQYMWHNGSNLTIRHRETGPLTGWHQVIIEDRDDRVTVWVDADTIFWRIPVQPLPDGYVGLGCDGTGDMTPAFDDVTYMGAAPVYSATWSAIKAVFR